VKSQFCVVLDGTSCKHLHLFMLGNTPPASACRFCALSSPVILLLYPDFNTTSQSCSRLRHCPELWSDELNSSLTHETTTRFCLRNVRKDRTGDIRGWYRAGIWSGGPKRTVPNWRWLCKIQLSFRRGVQGNSKDVPPRYFMHTLEHEHRSRRWTTSSKTQVM
jgi:hypothetical protein